MLGVVHRRRTEMEAAEQGVQFVDAGDFLGLLYGIDHAAMAARRQHDKAPVLHVVDRDVLVVVLIRDGLSTAPPTFSK